MQLNLKTQRLATMVPLSDLEGEAVRLLAFDGEEVKLEADTVLFKQGDAADCGYALLSGLVALERVGDIPVPTRLMQAGSLIGVNALITTVERPATATAREASLLLRLPRRLVLRVLEAFPDSAAAFKRHVEATIAARANSLARVAEAIDAVAGSYRSRSINTGT